MPSQSRMTVLAENMLKVLTSQRGLGPAAYPLPLHRLAQLTDSSADQKTILSLANPQRKSFSQHVVIVRRTLQVPVALREDQPMLLGSGPLLEFLIGEVRSDTNHAITLSALAEKVARAYRQDFQKSLELQIQTRTLPETVRCLLVNGSPRLFLQSDTRGGPAAESSAEEGLHRPEHAGPVQTDFTGTFDAAFDRLDRAGGSHNFVSLVDLRRALSVERQTFDNELHRLRVARRYSLSAAEGRHELTAEERSAGIWEENALLLHVSRKSA